MEMLDPLDSMVSDASGTYYDETGNIQLQSGSDATRTKNLWFNEVDEELQQEWNYASLKILKNITLLL